MPIHSFSRRPTLPALLMLAICAPLLLAGCSGACGDDPVSPDLAVTALEEVVNRDERVILDRSEIGTFINVVGEYERRSGVVVTRVQGLRSQGHRSDHRTSSAPVSLVPLRVDLRGSVDQFLLFMNLFENHERLVLVRGFRIEPGIAPDPQKPDNSR